MALSDATTMARPPADMLRALRSSLLSLLAELLTDSLTTTKLMLVTQALVRSTDIAHIAELFATVRARAPAKAALQCRLAAHILPSGAGACIAVAPQVCGVVGLRDDEAATGRRGRLALRHASSGTSYSSVAVARKPRAR